MCLKRLWSLRVSVFCNNTLDGRTLYHQCIIEIQIYIKCENSECENVRMWESERF